jgi:hypothetical protein
MEERPSQMAHLIREFLTSTPRSNDSSRVRWWPSKLVQLAERCSPRHIVTSNNAACTWELVNAERSVVKRMLILRADDLFELWHYQLLRTSR